MEHKPLTYVKLYVARRKTPKRREPPPDTRTPIQKYYDEKMIKAARKTFDWYEKLCEKDPPLDGRTIRFRRYNDGT